MDYNHTSIDADELRQLLEGPQRPVLVDVRLANDFEASHLPGALNNCVFEVAFMGRNVLYGSGKWFRHLGGHLVNDLVELQLRIVTA